MFKKTILLGAAYAALATPLAAQAGQEYIGEIITVGFNFCPAGWQELNGSLLSIEENTALFSLLGTTYGGDGQTTFAVPDLRGRAIISRGQGPGLSPYFEGQQTGQTGVTLTVSQLPAHTHTAAVRNVSAAGDTITPVRNSLAAAPSGKTVYSTVDPTVNMNAGDVNVLPTGGSQPVEKTSPRLAMLNCISLFGVFPSRP